MRALVAVMVVKGWSGKNVRALDAIIWQRSVSYLIRKARISYTAYISLRHEPCAEL